MFFWNSLAFSMIQQILAIWSLVPLPFLKVAWTWGSSRFTYYWSLAWRILSITLLACEIKSLIQFSVDGRGCLPSQLFGLRPNCGGGNEENGNLLQKIRCMHYCTQCPQPWSRPPPIHTSTRDSWTLTGKSGPVSCGVIAPISWVLVLIRFCLCPPGVCFPSPV